MHSCASLSRTLELLDGKLSRAVLRGAWGGDAPWLTRHWGQHTELPQTGSMIGGSSFYVSLSLTNG